MESSACRAYSALPEELARRLMMNVYFPFSACVCLNEEEEILSLWQFDSMFCEELPPLEAGTAQVWMMINHPEGDMKLREEDRRNVQALRRRMGAERLRVFVVSEDLGCAEILMPRG